MTTADAKISFPCHGCSRSFSVPASFAGRKATCKACGAKVVVPTVETRTNELEPAPRLPAASPLFAPPQENPASLNEPANEPSESAVAAPASLVLPAGASVMPPEPAEAAKIASPELPAEVSTTPPASPAASTAKSKVPMRVRRLISDADQMIRAFSAAKGPIQIKSTIGQPPEIYQIQYKVTGLQKGWLGRPSKRTSHLVEIHLTSTYPRTSPQCKMLTPVFHPNIDETTICVGDHWTAGERLVDLVVRIGEMLAYQAYNIKSPLNGEAAMWADLNPKKLPIDSRNLNPTDQLVPKK